MSHLPPTGGPDTFALLTARARLQAVIRTFFEQRQVLEVTTPSLANYGVTDPFIANLSVAYGDRSLYLQTSPEYAMKRLLADGSGSIYQVCQAFRGGETGRRHSPEFTMLEWYRVGFSLTDLMDEVEALLQEIGSAFGVEPGVLTRRRYRSLFEDRYHLNPHKADVAQLSRLLGQHFAEEKSHLTSRDGLSAYLDLLFSLGIEHELTTPVLVYDYPQIQAALADTHVVGEDRVASRFELFWQGMELANGYDELRDGLELRRRLEQNVKQRAELGLPQLAIDDGLLTAVAEMPACSGVAMGLDRLLMILLGKDRLDEVMPLPSVT